MQPLNLEISYSEPFAHTGSKQSWQIYYLINFALNGKFWDFIGLLILQGGAWLDMHVPTCTYASTKVGSPYIILLFTAKM